MSIKIQDASLAEILKLQQQRADVKQNERDYSRVGWAVLWIGGFTLGAGVGTLVLIAAFLANQWLGWIWSPFALATWVCALLGIPWQIRTIRRYWELEDFQVYGPAEPALEIETKADIRQIGNDILMRHYILQRPATRDACQAAGITQADWSRAISVMKEIGLRKGNLFADVPAEEALKRWGGLLWMDGEPMISDGKGKARRLKLWK